MYVKIEYKGVCLIRGVGTTNQGAKDREMLSSSREKRTEDAVRMIEILLSYPVK